MSNLIESRVLETTSTSGEVDDYVLGGNNGDFRTFGDVYLDTETFYYTRSDGANFEIGEGTYNGSADTITPGTILQSTNSGARVNWPAGQTSDIFVVLPGDRAPHVNVAKTGLIIPGITHAAGDSYHYDSASGLFKPNASRIFHKGSSPPSNLAAGIMWLDDTNDPWIWKIYDGATWLDFGRVYATENLAGSGWTFIEKLTAASSASLDFTNLHGGAFSHYMLSFNSILPNATASLYFRISQAAAFKSGGSDYAYQRTTYPHNAAFTSANNAADSAIRTNANSSSGVIAGRVFFYNPDHTSEKSMIQANLNYVDSAGRLVEDRCVGWYVGASTAIDGIQFLFSTGNIVSGSISLYGLSPHA